MMTARDEILGRVRTALRRKVGDTIPDAPPPALTFTRSAAAERAERFRLALEGLAGKVAIVQTPPQAGDYVRGAVGGRSFLSSHSPLLAACCIHRPHIS